MTKVLTVAKARKSPGSCGRCNKPIEVGAAYIWWAFFRSSKRVRCMTCPRPRQSELSGNEKLSMCYSAGESIEDALNAFRKDGELEDLRSAVEGAAETVREAAEAYRESASNIEEGFQHSTEKSDEMNEKADNLEGKADEIESAASSLEDFDEETETADAGLDIAEAVEDRAEKIKKIVEGKKLDWIEEQASNIDEFTDISPE